MKISKVSLIKTLMILAVAGWMMIHSAVSATANGADWKIKVKSAAVIDGPRVKLGDIADFYGDLPAKTKEDLANIELWNAPIKGRNPVYVGRAKLRVVLSHYLGELVANCVLPSSIALQSGGKVYTDDSLQKMIVKVLTPYAENYGGDYSFREYKLPQSIFLQDENDSLQIKLSRAFSPGKNSIIFREVSIDGRTVKQVSASVFVDVWKPVPCPVRPLNRKEIVTPDLITFKNQNIAHIGKRVWDGKGGPWRIKSPVGTGQPIMRSSLEPAPVIAKGDMVTLVYVGTHLKLSVPAKALSDGGIGESIMVRNLQSSRKVLVKVQDSQTVRVN